MELKNVARFKGVLAPGANALAITDGIKSAGAHWDGGEAPTAALIDLGGYYDISSLRLITYYGDGRYYHYEIYSSADGVEYTKIAEKKDDEAASSDGILHVFPTLCGRYIKINMLYNSANPSCHIAECEVFGVENNTYVPPKSEVTADGQNIALHKPCRTNSNQSFAFLCTDGSNNVAWAGEDYPRYCDVDLLENYDITSVSVCTPSEYNFGYAIYTSLDGVKYDFAAKGFTENDSEKLVSFDKPIEGRIIRVVINYSSAGPGGAPMISQIKATGEKSGSKVIPTRKILELESYEQWLKKTAGVDISKLPKKDGRYDIKQTYSANDTINALEGLVSRMLGAKYVSKFAFIVDRNSSEQYSEIYTEDGKTVIKGDCGVSIAAGLNHYLKYFCNVCITQQTKQVKMPRCMPKVKEKVRISSPYEVRYAYNYCTLSYTMPFYGYEDWQRELDFLFLSGVNLVLDLTATEALWVHYLQKLGYTVDEAKDYVCGYCYKAWWLMGNLEGTGGSVSDSWVVDTLNMARVNQRYMTVMGAMPALQTFVGAMPSTFGRIAKPHLLERGFSDVAEYMAPQGSWAGGFTRPNVLKTSYDGYSYLAKEFYASQDFIYGQNSDYYCGDVCHEGGIVPADLSKPQMARKILDELMVSNKDGRWILQAWWDNPMKETLDGFGEYRATNIIILDLAALAKPRWNNEVTWGGKEFGGCGWIFCNLDNYGGRTGIHGKLDEMSRLIADANDNSTLMKGIGITPEGTNANPAMFDLLWEMGWKSERVDIDKWIESYALRRYGVKSENAVKAWKIFEKTIYGKESYDGTTKNNVINENASLSHGYCTGPYFKIPYSRSEFEKGVSCLMDMLNEDKSILSNECYVYDAVDFMRQLLTNASDDIFETLKSAREQRDTEGFVKAKELFLRAMYIVNELAQYNSDETMGKWIGRAIDFTKDERNGEYDDYTIDTMKINAKALVTTWASSPITNYANRQFEGLMTDYFIVMWEKLLNKVEKELIEGSEPSESLSRKECFDIGWKMVISDREYSRKLGVPEGNEEFRGLAAIWQEIKEKFVSKEQIDTAKGADETYESEALKAQSKQD